MSPVEKGEVVDSILYLTLDVFFEVLDHCSQNSCRVGHLYGWRSSEMKTVVLIGARIATDRSPSFPNLLYTVCRSFSPLPDTFSTLFFFMDNFDGEV